MQNTNNKPNYSGLQYNITDKNGKILFTVHPEFGKNAHSYDIDQTVEETKHIQPHFDTRGIDVRIIYDDHYLKRQEEYWKEIRKKEAQINFHKRQSDPQWQTNCQTARVLVKRGLKAEAKKLIRDYLTQHEYI